MKRWWIAPFASLLLVAALGSGASAGSPHFIYATAMVNSSGYLVISFKEAGLGNDVTVNYHASADASATYYCINGGGNHPKATNKTTVSGPVSGDGRFTSDKNGSITGSLDPIAPPGPGDFSCPSGQRLVLGAVTYTNVMLHDVTFGVNAPIEGQFSRTFYSV